MKPIYPLPEKTELDEDLNLPFTGTFDPPELNSLKHLRKIKGDIDQTAETEIDSAASDIEDEAAKLITEHYFNGMEMGLGGRASVNYAPEFGGRFFYAVFPHSYEPKQRVAFLVDNKTSHKTIKKMFYNYLKEEQWQVILQEVKAAKDKWDIEQSLENSSNPMVQTEHKKIKL